MPLKPRRQSPNLIGKAKEFEIAGALIRQGLYVFFPLIDVGSDLVVTNRLSAKFVPLQIKFRSKASYLALAGNDWKKYKVIPRLMLVFIVGRHTWYVPYKDWYKKATLRKDGVRYITIRKEEQWLGKYEGCKGLKRFSKMWKLK